MLPYVARRFAAMVPLLLAVSLLVFSLVSLQPGDFVDELRLTNPNMTAADVAALREAYGLDRPFYVQYGLWLGRAVQGDFGISRNQYIPAAELVFGQRAGNSLALGASALLLSILIGIPVGVYAALRQYSAVDYATTFLSFLGFSLPIFWLGLMMLIVFSVQLKLFPAGGISSDDASPLAATQEIFTATGPVQRVFARDGRTVVVVETYDAAAGANANLEFVVPAGASTRVTAGEYVSAGQPLGQRASLFGWMRYLLDRAHYLVLPVVALSVIQTATWTRFMRASLLEVTSQDYVRTARAKGLPERVVIYKHALRNAVIPVVTLLGLSIPGLVNGAVITETVFNYPGMGLALFQSVVEKDYNPAMLILLTLALVTLVSNLLTDIAYALVNPRVRYGE